MRLNKILYIKNYENMNSHTSIACKEYCFKISVA